MRDSPKLHPILTEGLRQERLLQEAVIVNPTAIERYVTQYVQATRPEEGKVWFQKKLRAYLMNTPALLTLVNKQNSLYPEYANTAIAAGQPAYEFDDSNQSLGTAQTKFFHISDWFNAMAQVANHKPANEMETHDQLITKREMGKVMHYDPEMAYNKANEWFDLMGTRLKGTKEGVEVVFTWPDGFYAVRYTDPETMKIDGRDLQNCLQYGNYWDQVKKGTNSVYGIRKPNDEAVVGIRVDNSSHTPYIIECKGKNNDYVTATYRSYVVDFLNFLKVGERTGTYSGDLGNTITNIHYNNGKYGTFTDTADLVYDKGGLKIWKGDEKAVAGFGRIGELEVRYQKGRNGSVGGQIEDVSASPRMPVKIIIQALNIIARYPTKRATDQLQDIGVVYDSGKFTPLADAGKTLAEFDGYSVVALDARYILLQDGKIVYQADKNHAQITNIVNKNLKDDDDHTTAFRFLNTVGTAPNATVEMFILTSMHGVYDGTKYGPLEDLCEETDATDSASLWKIGDLNRWVVSGESMSNREIFLIVGASITKNGVGKDLSVNGINKTVTPDMKELVRRIIRNEKINAGPSDEIAKELVVLKVAGAIVTDIHEMFTHIDAIAKRYTTKVGDMPFGHIDLRLAEFLREQQGVRFDDEEKYGALLVKHMLPKKDRVTFRALKVRPVFEMKVTEYEVLLPLAPVEVFMTLMEDIPVILQMALKIGMTQATKIIRENKTDLYTMAETFRSLNGGTSRDDIRRFASPEVTMALRDLIEAVTSHNANLEATLRDKLKTISHDTPLSNRFAALNVMRMLDKGKK